MDPQENLKRQAEISQQIIDLWDKCEDDDELFKYYSPQFAELALVLAELAKAYTDWKKSGGF